MNSTSLSQILSHIGYLYFFGEKKKENSSENKTDTDTTAGEQQ